MPLVDKELVTRKYYRLSVYNDATAFSPAAHFDFDSKIKLLKFIRDNIRDATSFKVELMITSIGLDAAGRYTTDNYSDGEIDLSYYLKDIATVEEEEHTV